MKLFCSGLESSFDSSGSGPGEGYIKIDKSHPLYTDILNAIHRRKFESGEVFKKKTLTRCEIYLKNGSGSIITAFRSENGMIYKFTISDRSNEGDRGIPANPNFEI